MTSTSKRLLVAVLAVVLTLSVATLGITAFAVTTTDTIEYPFAKGDNAFKYAHTATARCNHIGRLLAIFPD